MPLVKSAKSLLETCTDFIIEIRSDCFCNKMQMSEQENEKLETLISDKSAMNPFDGLPSSLLDKLVNLLRNKLLIKDLYQYEMSPFLKTLLTTSNLRTLDLTRTKRDIHSLAMKSNILYQATVKSPHLETLRVHFFDCHYFVSQFSKLRVLEISYSETGNECFQILGTHCPELRELHAKFSKVSDDGIRELCVTGKCKSICVLDLTGCQQCTIKTIKMVLDNLLDLKVLLHESFFEGLTEIAQNVLDLKLQLPKYSLSSLHVIDKTVYKSGSLRQSLILCPNVTKVYLSLKVEGFKDIDLLSLLSLEKICIFVIRHYARKRGINQYEIDEDLTFTGGIAPLLKKFGSSLQTLSIEGYFIDVDIKVVIETCPNLQLLLLSSNSYKTTSTTEEVRNKLKRNQPVLKKLVTLGITSEDFCVPPQDLLMLLSSPSLAYVHIKRCDTLTDEIFHRVVNIHSFCNLKFLEFYRCDSFTEKGIENFMIETNPLRAISIDDCAKFTVANFHDWKQKDIWIKKNWQINFHIDD